MRMPWRRPHGAEPKSPFETSLRRNIAVLLITAVLSAGGIGLALWLLLGAPSIQVRGPWTATESFDFTKIVLSIVGGIGGVVALVIAYRRQRLGEAAEQRENAKERREDAKLFAENFTKATEQLGSENAPVRLAGMYALERLAQTPEQQQTIANVLCAYLRMPYTLPTSQAQDGGPNTGTTVNGETSHEPTPDNPDTKAVTRHDEERREQERQVRLTAQRILAEHLRPFADTFWADIDLDLTAATLLDFNLIGCHIRLISLDGAHFHGDAALFIGAEFYGLAEFNGAQFHGNAGFGGAVFHDIASFDGAHFDDGAWFEGAWFQGNASFDGAYFDGAEFGRAQFDGDASFNDAKFHGIAGFDDARVRIDVPNSQQRRWPAGYAVVEPRTAAEAHLPNTEGTWGYLRPIVTKESPHLMNSTDEGTA